jgi:hypothetical protein
LVKLLADKIEPSPTNQPVLSPALKAAAQRLLIDAGTLQAVRLFQAADIPCILLKGPSIARWLYDDPSERFYCDSDLLVPHDLLPQAENALLEAGFEKLSRDLPLNRPRVSMEWEDLTSGSAVDLHVSLTGIGAHPQRAWDTLVESTEKLFILNREVDVLGPAARALHLGLHACQHGHNDPHVLEDLRRGVERLPPRVWVEATNLARRLDAVAALASGLRLISEGRPVAADLGVATESSVEAELFSASLPHLELSFALGFEWLKSLPGLRSKFAYVARKTFPPIEWMKEWTPLAQRGFLGLTCAYVWRIVWLAAHASAGYRAWRRGSTTRADVRRSQL